MNNFKTAVGLIAVFLTITIFPVPMGGQWLGSPSLFVQNSLFAMILVAGGLVGLAIVTNRKKVFYKVPIKLAVLLLCFYGSALAVSSHMVGLPALVPYFLITLALLLVIFW